jgi:hypothetical protein
MLKYDIKQTSNFDDLLILVDHDDMLQTSATKK